MKGIEKRLTALETYITPDGVPDFESMTDAALEAYIARGRALDPAETAAIERMTDAELDALTRMTNAEAQAFVRSRMQ